MIEKIVRDHSALVRGRELQVDPRVELSILERNGGALTVYAAAHLLDLVADRCHFDASPLVDTRSIGSAVGRIGRASIERSVELPATE